MYNIGEMASWHLGQASGGVDHTYDGANGGELRIRSSPSVTPMTVALADITSYLGEILSTADNFPTARRPQSRFRRVLNATGWTESYGSTTMSYPISTSPGGVQVTVTATSETYQTGEPVAYCNAILSLCGLDVGPFQKVGQ